MAKQPVKSSVILRIAVPVPLDKLFDYIATDMADRSKLWPGLRVSVPFGKGQKTGVVMEVTDSSSVDAGRLKVIDRFIDNEPLLSHTDLRCLQWASRYYHYPIGEVIAAAFPALLRKGRPAVVGRECFLELTDTGRQIDPKQLRRAPRQQALLTALQQNRDGMLAATLQGERATVKALLGKGWLTERHQPPTSDLAAASRTMLPANAQQQAAIDGITADLGRFSVSLLDGVTGSGKTEVYMQVIAEALARHLQVLVLLPEIALTPQLEQRFRQRFAATIVSYHSKLTDPQRLDAWLALQQGRAHIMLGTRSALFVPMQRPGLLILDEEHDTSFKQQDGFRFSARDCAVVRAKMLDVPVVLGSATPSLESLYNVRQRRYQLHPLPMRAGTAIAPSLRLLDIRNQPLRDGLSDQLINNMHTVLANGQQVLLFLNRRGFAPVQICHSCGWVARCLRCDANLVIHFDDNLLRCHHCGREQTLLKACPACKTGELRPLGLGTERIEKSLAVLFADKTVVRLDRDTTQRKGTLENYLVQIHAGRADIILGTQMLAKGHHFPNVTLVALLDVDSGLFSVDYRAPEKLAQLIMQVAGRAGRADKPGQVILQTRHPDHPLLTTLLSRGYQAFAETALLERKHAHLPPYGYQALLRVQAADPSAPKEFLQAVCQQIAIHNSGKIDILGPVPAPMLKRAGQFRYQLLLQSDRRLALQTLLDQLVPALYALKSAGKVRWSLDVDPLDLY